MENYNIRGYYKLQLITIIHFNDYTLKIHVETHNICGQIINAFGFGLWEKLSYLSLKVFKIHKM